MAAVPFTAFIVACIRAGQKRLADGSQRAAVDAGHYLVVTPGMLLNVENLPASDGPYLSSCVTVSRELLLEQKWSVDADPSTWAVLSPSPVLDQAFAHAELGLQQELPQAVLVHRVRELLEALALSGFRPTLTNEPTVTERVRLLLAAAPEQTWRAEPIAEQLAMSVATLRRKLAAESTSFRAILEEVRLSHALTLIQTTTQPLKRIAEDCGYLSPSGFATRFRLRFGTLPSELRD
ncbi:helix-turn-helix transcriptional regulator [Dyella acidisoli]|nr:helix-turn-helix transcriptional regulator [Dyella acidisoli]